MRRTYRRQMTGTGLKYLSVHVLESDLRIAVSGPSWRKGLSRMAVAELRRVRSVIEDFIAREPDFGTTLEPYAVSVDAPDVIRQMAAAGAAVGVGPMAAVAGAIAEAVGKSLAKELPGAEVIVENGGDIWMRVLQARVVRLYTPTMPALSVFGLKVDADQCPVAVCTSSGTVGPSLSLGYAHAVTVVSQDAALADACATAGGNMILREEDVEKAVGFIAGIAGVLGVVVATGSVIGIKGDLELVRVE